MATCPDFTVTFDLDPQSSTTGKLVLTDTTDLNAMGITASDLEGAFTVRFPDGTSRVGNVLTNPDIDKDVSSVFTGIDIPKDSNGEYLEGTYKFEYIIQVSGGKTVSCSFQEKSFDFCPQTPDTANLDFQANCFCTELTVTDNTDYGNYDSLTRNYEVTPPPNTGQSTKTFSSRQFTYTFTHTGVYYVSVDNAVTYVDGAFTIKDRLTDSSNFTNIQCDIDLCGLFKCIQNFIDDLDKKAGRRGGYSELPAEDEEDLHRVLLMTRAFDSAVDCQKWSDATKYYNRLKDLIDCGCGEDSTSENRKVTPVCGSTGGGDDVDVVGGSNINVSSSTSGGTTTYTVSLAQSLIDTINQNATNLSNLAIDVSVKKDNFNSNVSSKAVITVAKTKSGFDWDFEIILKDPEGWHQIGDSNDPLYDDTVGDEILYLSATDQYDQNQPGQPLTAQLPGVEAKVRRTVTGYVEMEGAVRFRVGLTDKSLFVQNSFGSVYAPVTRLPVGYRPDQTKWFAAANSHGWESQAWVRVKADGDVAIIVAREKPQTDESQIVSFENVYYYAEQ